MPETQDAAKTIGKNVAYHRKRLGLSQVEFAGKIGKSESWVSQVERGVRGVDRLSVLQTVASSLNVSVDELRGTAGEPERTQAKDPQPFEDLRLALTSHPAASSVISPETVDVTNLPPLEDLRSEHSAVWPMVHASEYSDLAPLLTRLIKNLETTVRHAGNEAIATDARNLLADTYQAAAAALSKIGDGDAAWIASDRAAFVAEATGSPLALGASLFRMAHVFLGLRLLEQTQKVASDAVTALQPKVDTATPDIQALSLYGAFHLVLAVTAARENQRSEAHSYLEIARTVAEQVGDGRNDFGTEFSPTNVALHAVGVAVALGDAGQAIDLSQDIEADSLSPERRARYLIDLAEAYAMRRQIGESLKCLQESESLTPEQTRTHRVAREVARDLLQLSGAHVRPELHELVERFGLS